MIFFFFFQAEDGIRDSSVTGVQTCALPISISIFDRDSGGAVHRPDFCRAQKIEIAVGASAELRQRAFAIVGYIDVADWSGGGGRERGGWGKRGEFGGRRII